MPTNTSDNIDSFIKTEPKILGYTDFFPYEKYRDDQEKVIQNLSESIALGKNCLLIASNGTGKTIMALAAALPISMYDKKRKIIFCSRTFSQNARVIQESKKITQNFAQRNINRTIGVLSLRGRNEMCPHKVLQRLKLPPNESMSLCSSLRKNKKCKYFNNLFRLKKTAPFKEQMDSLSQMPIDAQELMEFSELDEVCPYFLSKLLMENEDIIVCNYQWIFDPIIRDNFLESVGTTLADCIIIMDECHNLPEMANGINSYRLTPYSLRQAIKDMEIARAKYNQVAFLKYLRDSLERIKDRVQEEIELDPHKFIQQTLTDNKLNSTKELLELLLDLEDYGKAIEQEKIDQGNIPRDFISPIVEFYRQMMAHLDDSAYFPCITATNTSKGKAIAMELKCLSALSITDPIFKESFATLSLSGTLHPFTYTHLLGLDHTGKMLKIVKMKPPFPKENIKVLLTAQLNTKGESRTSAMYREILIALKPIILNTPKNVGVFCASYDVANGLWENGFQKLVTMCNKKAFREVSGFGADENDTMIENYKNCINRPNIDGGVLLGVCGGRNSEGEDFPGDYMNSVVIVGVPFQRPTPSGTAKIQYYESLFPGQGRIFGYLVPAMQRSNQACGRPIRKMDDRGIIVLMDYRFGNFESYLSEWVARDIKRIPYHPNIIENEFKSFFNKL